MDSKLTRRQFLRYALYGAVAVAATKGAYNSSRYSVKLENVSVKIKNLPKSFVGFKIGILTDIHSSFFVNEGFIAQGARLLMSGSPDMIVLLGDYVTGETKFLNSSVGSFDPMKIEKCVVGFKELKAPHGIYAVTGNHDHWSGEGAIREITSRFTGALGVKWLRNANVKIEKNNEFLTILGIDDYWHSGSAHEALNRAPKDGVRILLSHNPDVNEELDLMKERVDLVLSGHTHGGQIKLPLLGAPFIPSNTGQKYLSGLVRDGERQTYVSRGLGTLMVPIRINALPEVTILTLVA